ncbi:MAG: RiPP maturation radical SAM C-methyltransferase [Acidobacteriota bacterium]
MDRVLLLNMPFVSLGRPAIGISLLKPRLKQEGIQCDVAYPNLFFAECAGLRAYSLINDQMSPAFFVGDWLFAQHLFADRLDCETYVATLRAHLKDPGEFELLMQTREQVPAFLDACLEKFRIADYGIIGFTTTFEQNLASLALARRIKTQYPEKTIVFGGTNCEGVMGLELHRSFPWIDYVCSGESDYTFPRLVKAVFSGQPVLEIGGVLHRQGGVSVLAGPPDQAHEMDRLPDPDFDDYFAALARSVIGSEISPALLIETARGCWWGAKSHCTFCGLNGATMTFRAKSAPRVLAELERQKQRYGINRFLAVDNIMAHNYFKDLLPLLKERRPGVSLFYEIKANLNRRQVELLSDAGVKAIQPGIESLSTHVLHLMNKGVTAIQNIQLLKWCREFGVDLAWNLLYGFPGETPEDYQETARTIEAVYHLKPPGAVSVIRLDRFSPYFNSPESYGLVNIRPFDIYRYIYPLPPERIANVAYFFQYDYGDGRRPDSYMRETLERVKAWKENGGGDLTKRYGADPEMLITDTRPGRPPLQYALNGIQRQVYDYCQEARSRASLESFVGMQNGWLDAFLEQMLAWQLMIREGNQHLSLAVTAS